MCGTFGYELNVMDLSIKDRLLFKEQIAVYKAVAPLIKNGDLYRLWDPFKSTFASMMYVSRDKDEAVVFAFSVNSDHWNNLVPRLVLAGLDPDFEYDVTEIMPNNVVQSSKNLTIMEMEGPVYQLGYPSVVLSGKILMNAGLPIKFYTLDDSVMFILGKTKREQSSPVLRMIKKMRESYLTSYSSTP